MTHPGATIGDSHLNPTMMWPERPKSPVDPRVAHVQGSRMLKDLGERTVKSLAQQSTMVAFKPGELLHYAGEPMDKVSFLCKGRVKVYRVSAEGKQQTIDMPGPGESFGEIGVVDPQDQDLYVEALENVVVCRMTRDAFLEMCSRDPALGVRLAESIGEKLQIAREQIADFAFRDVRGRLSNLLLTLLERKRRLSGDDEVDRFAPGMTHREMADLIGTRRESVTKTLKALELEGLIAIEGKEIVLVDSDGLREAAGT